MSYESAGPASSEAGLLLWRGETVPTEAKREAVTELAERLSKAAIVIATDFSGLKVNQMTELRHRLREQGVEYRVVKNRIASIAAGESGVEAFRDILEGATGVVLGYDDPVAAAKAVNDYVRQTRAELKVRKGVMDGALISEAQVVALAALPGRDELVAKLLGQMNAPISGLVNVLSGPTRALAIVLQRRAEQLGAA
ncbi:MAG: 50S ribosomal protein L10 [Chloroflexi bacterium]|nr:50S ribosomal protein L10 [Chloroflexota bacterium]MYB85441.1 50S ribosomal protein L10 [Chloroflexota bacterium]